ncbi:MAG TPA: hypothetical protein VMW62_16850 [Chloroflexota bacterium]|nr:hypothetical protein [Chloroflexota bacterium]
MEPEQNRGGRPRRYARRTVAKSVPLDPAIYDELVRRSPNNISRAVNDLLADALEQDKVREAVHEMARLLDVEIDTDVSAKAAAEFEAIFQRVERRRADRAARSAVA